MKYKNKTRIQELESLLERKYGEIRRLKQEIEINGLEYSSFSMMIQ